MKNTHSPSAQNPQTANYADLLPSGATVTVTLNADEIGAVFAAYDYGIELLNKRTIATLEQAIASLKLELWH